MKINESESFKFGNNEVKFYKINVDLSKQLGNDFDKLITKFFNRQRGSYKIYKCYEFYNANGDFIEESEFLNNLGEDDEFNFVSEDRAHNLKEILNVDTNYFLDHFNEGVLNNSQHKATDVYIYSDDKLDNIKITFQIKLENK